jgi:nucleoid DNA-binding protein
VNLNDVAREVARRTSSDKDFVFSMLSEFVEVLVEMVQQGNDVKIRNLGTLKWVPVKPQTVIFGGQKIRLPAGVKLKLMPARNLRGRRKMSDDEMVKYGVVTEDPEHVKEASEGKGDGCPICNSELDLGGACPVHGTEPFERGESNDEG